jgi:hypothetical protein
VRLGVNVSRHRLETQKMEWIPVVFVTFKALVLGIGMFFAVKWHYDQGKKGKLDERRAVLRAAGKVAAIFVVALLGLGLFTSFLLRMIGWDLPFP